jgi:hypothetical protein
LDKLCKKGDKEDNKRADKTAIADIKETVEQITFEHTKRVLRGKITVVFYDMTTIYFEASD